MPEAPKVRTHSVRLVPYQTGDEQGAELVCHGCGARWAPNTDRVELSQQICGGDEP